MTAAINSTGAGKRGYPTKSSVPYTQASTQRRARERSVAIQTLLLVRKSKSSSVKSKDRKSGSAGMPRPISYAVFCLKKKQPSRHQDGERPAVPGRHGRRHSEESETRCRR